MDEIHIWKVLVSLGPELPAEILYGFFESAETVVLLLALAWLIRWDWPRRHPNALAIGLLVYFKTWNNLWYYFFLITDFYPWGITLQCALDGLVHIALPLALLIAALGRHLRLRLKIFRMV